MVARERRQKVGCLKKDPIKLFKQKLKDSGLINSIDVDAIEKEVNETIELAVKYATNSKSPNIKSIVEDIYSDKIK